MTGLISSPRGKTAVMLMLACMVLAICPGQTFLSPEPALAGPHGPGRGRGHGPGIWRLPQGHGYRDFRGDRYFFYGGNYFRHHDRGYVMVRPPRGLVVGRLPLGYAALVIAGITYFTFLGTWYQRVPAGYMVVAPPPNAPITSPAPATASGSVTVTAPALNVRQGPGFGHAVLEVVTLGQTLNVFATTPGWLYVQTPAGHMGWVDQRYTTLLPTPGASG